MLGRKCRAQRSVTVKALERWPLTVTCREMDITQTHTLHALSLDTPPMHPLDSHTHTITCTHCFCFRSFVCVCVFLSFSDTPLLPRRSYKLFFVPGAPLVVSDRSCPSCFFCLPVSVIGQLRCTVSCCLRPTYRTEQKEKQAARIYNLREGGKNSWVEIKHLNLLC